MLNSSIRTLIAFAGAGTLSLCFGGASVIGLAVVNGTARVDHAEVRGNASVLDGSLIETGKGSSQLSLQSGARVEFGAASRGKVYRDRVVLEKGIGQFHAAGYPLLANSLRVVSTDVGSTVRVAVKSDTSIQVAALSGQARVLNNNGLLLAMVTPGKTMEFSEQAGAAAQAQLTGTISVSGGQYLLKDDTTNVVSQITCTDMTKYVNKRVTVTGSIDTSATPVPGASQVVCVGSHGIAAMAATAGAGAAAGGVAAAGAGIGMGTTVAIIGGVAVAGTLGGLAATGHLGNGGNSSNGG